MESFENSCLLPNEEKPSIWRILTSLRWRLALITSLMTLLLFCLKNCMAMTLVCMEAQIRLSEKDMTNITDRNSSIRTTTLSA